MSVEELVKRLRKAGFRSAADKLEELAAKHDKLMDYAIEMMNRAVDAEADLAEAKRENEALREDRDFLQEILDTRPAINADLPESYIRWSQSLYSGEAVRAWLSARNAGGNDEPCPGCGDGDKVPASDYWRCPVCDAEWSGEDAQ